MKFYLWFVHGEFHTNYDQLMCKVEILSAVCRIRPTVRYMWHSLVNVFKLPVIAFVYFNVIHLLERDVDVLTCKEACYSCLYTIYYSL